MMFSCLFCVTEVITAFAVTPTGTKVELPSAIHFLNAGGEDVIVGPGWYHVEVAESWLKLVPEGEGRMSAILLEGTSGTHEEILAESAARVVSDTVDPNVFHVALLHPGGTGLEAIGTKSGIRPRGFNFKFLKKMNTRPPRQLIPLPATPERFSSLKFSKPGFATKLASDLHDRCVLDVESQITQTLHDGGDYRDLLAYRPGGTGEPIVKHTGLDEKDGQEWKHRQGVARYFSGQENYLYVSNSVNATVNQGKHVAGIEVIALNQHKDSGRLGSNIRNNRYQPPSSGYTVMNYVEEADSHQSGGIQIMGRFLLVPYAGKPDYLRLYDLQDPKNPGSAATVRSEHNIHFKFAALTRLNNGRYLAIGGSDLVEVFVTKDTEPLDAWESHSAYKPGKAFLHSSTGPVPEVKYQGAQFVTDCSGTLYLVLSRKSKNWRNEFTADWLDVWRTSVHESKGKYSIELIKKFSRQMNCEGGGDTRWCDFGAGAGLFIDRENGDILMYGIEPGGKGPKVEGVGSIKMKEFRQN
jgi:hypothetical protein